MSDRSLTGYDNEDETSERPGERARRGGVPLRRAKRDTDLRLLRPVGSTPDGRSRPGTLRRRPRARRRPARELARAVDLRQHPRLDLGELDERAVPVALPLKRRAPVLRQRDPLVPGIDDPTREEHINGNGQQVGVENVYEYEPAGVGGCARQLRRMRRAALRAAPPAKNRRSWKLPQPAAKSSSSPPRRLSPYDTDDAFDIYDARECTTSSPCLPAPQTAPQPCNATGTCRPGSAPGLTPLQPPGTATLLGPGNPKPQPNSHASQGIKGTHATSKPPTRAQKLAKALTKCRRRHTHSPKKRKACEASARKLYGQRPAPRSRGSGRGGR